MDTTQLYKNAYASLLAILGVIVFGLVYLAGGFSWGFYKNPVSPAQLGSVLWFEAIILAFIVIFTVLVIHRLGCKKATTTPEQVTQPQPDHD